MFKYLIVSIVLVPVLLGLLAASRSKPGEASSVLVAGYVIFGVFWVALLYFLRFRWS